MTLNCRGSIGEDEPADFTVDLDAATSDVTEADVRWMTTDGDTTIDWDLNRHSVLRAVILTGADAGLMISGDCDVRASAMKRPVENSY